MDDRTTIDQGSSAGGPGCQSVIADDQKIKYRGIIDTHAHYDDSAYNEDRRELIVSMPENGIEAVVNVGSTVKGAYQSIELAKKYEYFFAAVGVHPDEVHILTEEEIELFSASTAYEKVVAIGEIGLDYHNMGSDKETQHKWFRRQMDLSLAVKLPVIIHSRDAYNDTRDIISEYSDKLYGCLMHCYSYSPECALELKKLGCKFGIGGVVTFKNGKKLKETVDALELDDIMLETDAPYLAPEPYRGKRNNSLYISYIAEAVAEIKKVSVNEVIDVTAENARRFFPRMTSWEV